MVYLIVICNISSVVHWFMLELVCWVGTLGSPFFLHPLSFIHILVCIFNILQLCYNCYILRFFIVRNLLQIFASFYILLLSHYTALYHLINLSLINLLLILSYLILSYIIILSYFIWSYFIFILSFFFILFYFILSYLIVLSYLILIDLILFFINLLLIFL